MPPRALSKPPRASVLRRRDAQWHQVLHSTSPAPLPECPAQPPRPRFPSNESSCEESLTYTPAALDSLVANVTNRSLTTRQRMRLLPRPSLVVPHPISKHDPAACKRRLAATALRAANLDHHGRTLAVSAATRSFHGLSDYSHFLQPPPSERTVRPFRTPVSLLSSHYRLRSLPVRVFCNPHNHSRAATCEICRRPRTDLCYPPRRMRSRRHSARVRASPSIQPSSPQSAPEDFMTDFVWYPPDAVQRAKASHIPNAHAPQPQGKSNAQLVKEALKEFDLMNRDDDDDDENNSDNTSGSSDSVKGEIVGGKTGKKATNNPLANSDEHTPLIADPKTIPGALDFNAMLDGWIQNPDSVIKVPEAMEDVTADALPDRLGDNGRSAPDAANAPNPAPVTDVIELSTYDKELDMAMSYCASPSKADKKALMNANKAVGKGAKRKQTPIEIKRDGKRRRLAKIELAEIELAKAEAKLELDIDAAGNLVYKNENTLDTVKLEKEEDVSLAKQYAVPLAEQEDVPLAEQEIDVPLAKQEDVPLAEQEPDVPLAKQEDVPFANEDDVPLAKQEDILQEAINSKTEIKDEDDIVVKIEDVIDVIDVEEEGPIAPINDANEVAPNKKVEARGSSRRAIVVDLDLVIENSRERWSAVLKKVTQKIASLSEVDIPELIRTEIRDRSFADVARVLVRCTGMNEDTELEGNLLREIQLAFTEVEAPRKSKAILNLLERCSLSGIVIGAIYRGNEESLGDDLIRAGLNEVIPEAACVMVDSKGQWPYVEQWRDAACRCGVRGTEALFLMGGEGRAFGGEIAAESLDARWIVVGDDADDRSILEVLEEEGGKVQHSVLISEGYQALCEGLTEARARRQKMRVVVIRSTDALFHSGVVEYGKGTDEADTEGKLVSLVKFDGDGEREWVRNGDSLPLSEKDYESLMKAGFPPLLSPDDLDQVDAIYNNN